LARLVDAGLPVPDGLHVTTAAYREFVDHNHLQPRILAALNRIDVERPPTLEAASSAIRSAFAAAEIPAEVASTIASAYAELPGTEPAVAVRSSATAEDLPEAAFAGQQDTFLNVRGASAVLQAVRRCWASLWTARAIGYRQRQAIDHRAVALAVVVQVLVPADSAGILFTANPLTGRRDQAVINASWGLGESVVGGSVTPDTLVVDKASSALVERQIGDKQVRTVLAEGGAEERPVPTELRRAPALDNASIADLNRLGVQIESLYRTPMDIEWAISEGEIAILQARPITALPPPPVPPPLQWEVPNPRARYMRNNIVELMADPLTPLFATLGRSIINRSMNRTLAESLGGPGLVPDELIVTINGYAYYNGAFTPGQILRILLKSVGIARRMFTGMVDRWHDALEQYQDTVDAWEARDLQSATTEDLLHGVRTVFDSAIDYYMAIVGGVVPAAWITEGLFTLVYRRLIRRQDDPPAATYLLGFDSQPIQAEKGLYDLAQSVRSQADLAAHLIELPVADYSAPIASAPAAVTEEVWGEWWDRWQAHLDEYGGTIYDLDFVQPTPADDPTPLAQSLKLYLSGRGVDPHERQQAAAAHREQATQRMLGRLKRLRRRLFSSTLERAQRYAPLREDSLASIGLGYPLLRGMLLELGRRLVSAEGTLDPNDVFWLVEDEVKRAGAALLHGGTVDRMTDRVQERKALWQARKRVTPPMSLPLPPKWLRRLLPAQFGIEPDAAEQLASTAIRGIPCSGGRVTAPARVLHGPAEFGQMQPGEILVAAITTPAWTPLFALASAIVTDVGGPLSHGSIVAREYGIPAVLGTGVATRRLRSGQMIAVDGSQGTVEILPEV
jgi:pyruvate,water dikinase